MERKYEKHKAQFHNGRFFPVYEIADFFRVLVSIHVHCISTGHMQCMGVTHYSHSFFFFYFHLKYIKNKHDELLGLIENGKIHPKNEQKCNSKKKKKIPRSLANFTMKDRKDDTNHCYRLSSFNLKTVCPVLLKIIRLLSLIYTSKCVLYTLQIPA